MKHENIRYKNPYSRGWADAEVQRYGELMAQGWTSKAIADKYGDTFKRVDHLKFRLRQLGYIFPDLRGKPRPCTWHKEQDDILIEMFNSGADSKQISDAVGHSLSAVEGRLAHLRRAGHDIPWHKRCPHKKKVSKIFPDPGV